MTHARSRFARPLSGLLCSLCTVLLLVAGCGGGNNKEITPSVDTPATAIGVTGRATLTIHWPQASSSRLIPDLSRSIVVEVLRGEQVFDSKRVERPANASTTSTVTFDSLPVDTINLKATAFPNADGTGVAQAKGTSEITVLANLTLPIDLVMNSTVDRIEVAPTGPLNLKTGETATVTATARDASNAIVLLSPAKTAWTSSATGVATVNAASGLVTAVSAGTTQLAFTDSESGKSATITLNVTAPPVVTPKAGFYTTMVRSNEITHYDSAGKILETIIVPSSLTTELRGVAIGPDGLLYVAGVAKEDTRVVAVLTVDSKKTIRRVFSYLDVDNSSLGPGGIGYYSGLGHIVFDRSGNLYVVSMGGIIRFPRGGTVNSGVGFFWGSDIELLPSGNLLVIDYRSALEVSTNGTIVRNLGNLFSEVFKTSGFSSIAYNERTNTLYATAVGPRQEGELLSFDGTTYALKKKISTVPQNKDLCLTDDGRVAVCAFSGVLGIVGQSPVMFDEELNRLGEFEGSQRTFITHGTITGTSP